MEHKDQPGKFGARDSDVERGDAGVERHVVDPGTVLPFRPTDEPELAGANDGSDDSWPFDDLAMPSDIPEHARTVEGPVALVIPRRGKRDASIDAAGELAESRIHLYWRDSHCIDPEGLVLADAEGCVLDVETFRKLRDQLGAWIDASGQEREVLQALHFASHRMGEPGIGAPVL